MATLMIRNVDDFGGPPMRTHVDMLMASCPLHFRQFNLRTARPIST